MIQQLPGVAGDPTVKNTGHSHPVRLAADVTGVKTGTPLVATADGYRVGQPAALFAAAAAIGGETVVAYRHCVLEVHGRVFAQGVPVTIKEVDAYGGLTFDPPPPAPAAPVAPAPAGETTAGEASAPTTTTRTTTAPKGTPLPPGTYLVLDDTHVLLEGV